MSQHAQRTITTLGGILVSLILTIFGSALLYWGCAIPAEHEFGREMLKSFGSIVVATGMLSFMWELFSKRSFLAESLALANMTIELKNAGIEQVSTQYLNELQWQGMLKASQSLEFFFAYARTWCNVNSVCLGEVLRMKNRTMRVLLPDPTNAQIVSELARRFSSTPQEVETSIKETQSFFEKLGNRAAEGSTLEVRYAPAAPLFSMYLLGERAVFSLYAHQSRKSHVPTYVVKREGLMFKYLEDEFEVLWGKATLVYTSKPATPVSGTR